MTVPLSRNVSFGEAPVPLETPPAHVARADAILWTRAGTFARQAAPAGRVTGRRGARDGSPNATAAILWIGAGRSAGHAGAGRAGG
jgi:hypothetical protein